MPKEVDESSKQMKDLGRWPQRDTLGEMHAQFVKIAEVPRMLHRMRHSNTSKESIDKIQKMYNSTYRLKGRNRENNA